MNASAENTSAENTSAENTSAENDDRRPSDPNAPATEPATEPIPEEPITEEEWERLRAPFSRYAYVVDSRATGRVEANLPVEGNGQEEASETDRLNRVVADLRLRAEVIRSRLDLVLGPGRYSYRFEPAEDGSAERVIFCHLRIGTTSRTGIGTATSYGPAQRVALAGAALGFGIGASGKTAGPVVLRRESRNDVPSSILESLEKRSDSSFWGPEDSD